MEILEPVQKDKIPHARNVRTDYDAMFERALALNGLALPVQFETEDEAEKLASLLRTSRSRGAQMGLSCIRRENTVFVYRKNPA